METLRKVGRLETIEIDFEGGFNLLSLALTIPPTLILM